MKQELGTIKCRTCENTAVVKKNTKKKFYYVCPGCGLVQPAGKAAQEWLTNHSTWYAGCSPAELENDAEESESRSEVAPPPPLPPKPENNFRSKLSSLLTLD